MTLGTIQYFLLTRESDTWENRYFMLLAFLLEVRIYEIKPPRLLTGISILLFGTIFDVPVVLNDNQDTLAFRVTHFTYNEG